MEDLTDLALDYVRGEVKNIGSDRMDWMEYLYDGHRGYRDAVKGGDDAGADAILEQFAAMVKDESDTILEML